MILPRVVVSVALLSMVSGNLGAQVAENRSAQVSRKQIEAVAAEAEKISSSPGYSGRLKDEKRRELALMRNRLTEGDLLPGDQIVLLVQDEPTLTGTFVVGPGGVLSLPNIPDISLRGTLRSELKDHLTAVFSRYIRDPSVRVQATVRLSVLGSVGKPGFYQIPSELLAGDVIMAAGGPMGGANPNQTAVQRSGLVIMSKEAFRQALTDGKTVDQLNLRAGDELLVGGSVAGSRSNGRILPIVSAAASMSYLLIRIFRIF